METVSTFAVPNPSNVKSIVTDPHRAKDFLDPTEITLSQPLGLPLTPIAC
jgi:hypothetical protein